MEEPVYDEDQNVIDVIQEDGLMKSMTDGSGGSSDGEKKRIMSEELNLTEYER